jgi:hypothetical protein
VENPDHDSPLFHFKWAVKCADIDHGSLAAGQLVNHFARAACITTKVGKRTPEQTYTARYLYLAMLRLWSNAYVCLQIGYHSNLVVCSGHMVYEVGCSQSGEQSSCPTAFCFCLRQLHIPPAAGNGL